MSNAEFFAETISKAEPVGEIRSIGLRAVESDDKCNFITVEGFLEVFYRGDFAYCLQDAIWYENKPRYTIESIRAHLPSFNVERCVEGPHRTDLLCRGENWWAVISVRSSAVFVEYGVNSLEQGRELAATLKKGLSTKEKSDVTVDYEVWAGRDVPFERTMPDLHWENVVQNYPLDTREGIERLTTLKPNASSRDGRVILFHGPPGTGKTHAVRALLTEWKKWATAVLVLDPENFLDSARYMMTIMERSTLDMTRVIVIEDADELVAKRGARRSGLSRLLNAADGILGANGETLFLLSTNAGPDQLDPALTRPGRCLATVCFDPFPIKEANERLGSFGPTNSSVTLAEIYRLVGETTHYSNEKLFSVGQYL